MPEEEKMGPGEAYPVSRHARFELMFVAGLIIFSILASLAFVLMTVVGPFGFPSTFVAVLLGLAIAAALYRFLGGAAGATVTIGAAKLAGTAALFAVVFYLVDGPLQKNMNDVKAIAAAHEAEASVEAAKSEAIKERTARKQLELRVAELESGAGIREADSVAAILARIRASKADDDLGEGLIAIARNKEGPWRRQASRYKARFLHSVPNGTFWFCHDRRPELQDRDVRFELVNREAGTSEKVTLRGGGDIGLGVCTDIQFDVQLGCDAARELLKLECSTQRGVAWPHDMGTREFELIATTVTPDL